MNQLIRLLIADDHILFRDGLTSLLRDEPDLEVLGQAGTGEEALCQIRQHQPDVVLLDISMPVLSGLEVASQINAELSTIKILMLTIHEEENFFFEALRAGAHGYVLKGARSEELMNAIRIVYSGETYLPPSLAGSLVQDFLSRQFRPPLDDSLTSREYDVLTLIAKGLTNRQIAEKLSLSLSTIKTHRAHIYQKLNLNDRASLVAYARRHGLPYAAQA